MLPEAKVLSDQRGSRFENSASGFAAHRNTNPSTLNSSEGKFHTRYYARYHRAEAPDRIFAPYRAVNSACSTEQELRKRRSISPIVDPLIKSSWYKNVWSAMIASSSFARRATLREVSTVEVGFSGFRRLPRWVSKTLMYSVISLALVASPLVGWAAFLQLTGNVHTVETHVLYRSAQLDGDDLEGLIQNEGIATVLNLRGADPGQRWYVQELQATTAAGAQHLDLAMSANQQPNRKTLKRLMEILRTAPKPLLVHCNGGADRSGLAAAIYELLDANKSPAEAAQQLSFRYGHFPWLTSRTGAMDRTFFALANQSP